jgi:hypothetical protein
MSANFSLNFAFLGAIYKGIVVLRFFVTQLRIRLDPPQPPLKRGENLNSSPFLRGIEGDLFESL